MPGYSPWRITTLDFKSRDNLLGYKAALQNAWPELIEVDENAERPNVLLYRLCMRKGYPEIWKTAKRMAAEYGATSFMDMESLEGEAPGPLLSYLEKVIGGESCPWDDRLFISKTAKGDVALKGLAQLYKDEDHYIEVEPTLGGHCALRFNPCNMDEAQDSLKAILVSIENVVNDLTNGIIEKSPQSRTTSP